MGKNGGIEDLVIMTMMGSEIMRLNLHERQKPEVEQRVGDGMRGRDENERTLRKTLRWTEENAVRQEMEEVMIR